MLLGYDVGSSSVKASIIDEHSGCLASAFYPKEEAPIISSKVGWAEQEPARWWEYLKEATREVLSHIRDPKQIEAIGISYQMHGLVCVDEKLEPLRSAIIWCDSRAVPYGEAAFKTLGPELCLGRLLNSPGNFTAAKLAWVKENEPELYSRIYKIMLPGDYIALRLSGECTTTVGGLSEGILWDYKANAPADFLMKYYGFSPSLLPKVVPTFGYQGELSGAAASLLGLCAGTPICYRAGDQPNNALSLNVLDPGEVASTAGTSGVVYGVCDALKPDPLSRVGSFAHVNHSFAEPRIGELLCINGTGILNSWLRKNIVPAGLSYSDINSAAASVPQGSEGLTVLPFGNGAERMLENKTIGCHIAGLDFNRHSWKHIARASQEGIVFSFAYGMEIMRQMGMNIGEIHAGLANMFLSPIFRQTLSDISGAEIKLYDTDGSVGAARGAGLGLGMQREEIFQGLKQLSSVTPHHSSELADAYSRWKDYLKTKI